MNEIYVLLLSETGPSAASHKEVMKLRRDNQNLSEENNLLKLKIDILLDMVGITLFKYSICVFHLNDFWPSNGP
jgi:hypothetical protein